MNHRVITDATQTSTLRTQSVNWTLRKTKQKRSEWVRIVQTCHGCVSLFHYVNHGARRGLEASTSNSKLSWKWLIQFLPRLVRGWSLGIIILLLGLRVQRCCGCCCWRTVDWRDWLHVRRRPCGYANGKPESRWRSGSAALVIQTFRGHANLGPDECGTLVMDAGR